jgi:hypothetical protein
MLQSNIDIAGPPLESMKNVSLTVYSWGETQSLPDTRHGEPIFKLPDFLLNYYGFVAFKH